MSRTFARPDGQVDLEIGAGPLHALHRGEWKPIDTTLAVDGAVVRPKVPGADVSFSAGGTGPAARLADGAGSIALAWPGSLPAPVLSGDTATYRDVAPSTDLVLRAGRTGFEQSLVLRERPLVAPTFRLPVSQAGGWTLSAPAGRGLRLSDASGAVLAQGPPPVMFGAAKDPLTGEPTRKAGLTVQIVTGATGAELQIKPDPVFLTDPSVTYPLTLDPAVGLARTADTYVQQGFGADGVNYDTANELRTGFQGTAKARTLIKFNLAPYTGGGRVFSNAIVYLYNFSSSTCLGDRRTSLYQVTGSWSATGVTWNNQPTYGSTVVSQTNAAYGATGCPAAQYMAFGGTGVKDLVQQWADTTVPNYGFVVRGDEADTLSFKKFYSAEFGGPNTAPYLQVSYNTLPVAAVQSPAPGAHVAQAQPVLRAAFTDADGGSGFVGYTVTNLAGTVLASGNGPTVPSSAVSPFTLPALGDGSYRWRARANDGTAAGGYTPWYDLTIDTVAPPTPTVTSTTYPNSTDWFSSPGQPATFEFNPNGTGVSSFLYDVDEPLPATSVNAATSGNTSVTFKPGGGPHTLYVRSRDRAGNLSPVFAFPFKVAPGAPAGVKSGDETSRYVTFSVRGRSAYPYLKLRYRAGSADPWTDVSPNDIRDGNGNPAPSTNGFVLFSSAENPTEQTPTWTWDVLPYRPAGAPDGSFEFDVAFYTGTFQLHAASTPVQMKMDTVGLSSSHATDEIGPGSVNLITGNYTLSATDVSIGSFGSDLTIGRTFTSRDVPSSGVFGPGWKPSFAVESAGSDYKDLTEAGSAVTVAFADGSFVGFTAASGGGYTPELGAEDLKLTKSSGNFTLADTDGNSTLFEPSGTAGKYRVKSVTQPGNSNTTSYTYDTSGRVTRILAPVPLGVTCAASGTLAAGCRAVHIGYATATTATGTAEANWGDVANQVSVISFSAFDPATNTTPPPTEVARYKYDNTGRLRAVYDPRLYPTLMSNYAVRYDYNANGQVQTLTPPGQLPWTITYQAGPGESATTGRLRSVSRPSQSDGSQPAVETVIYNVPVAGGPYNLQSAEVARWGQQQVPVAATAVFPPTQIPTSPPTSYTKATITYTDSRGRAVNVVTPGGHTTTSQYDTFGNVVRELAAGNRAAALDESATDTATQEAAIAALLYTERVYSDDGVDVLVETGPRHKVATPGSDTPVEARTRTVTTYDENKPDLSRSYHLPTTIKTHALLDDGTVVDERVTTKTYNWDLLKETSSTVDPGGLAIVSAASYDVVTGLPVESRLPSESGSVDQHTMVNVYYTPGAHPTDSDCGSKPQFANLVCKFKPKAQPASGSQLPVKLFTYTRFNQPDVVKEFVAGTEVRRTTIGYDAAGRRTTESTVAMNGATIGTALPTVTTSYVPATGQVHQTTASGAGTVTRGYDNLGRQTSYADADGNTATVDSFDVAGRALTSRDRPTSGLRTTTYNETLEPRGLVTSITEPGIGTFNATYDPDGRPLTQTYPNGIRADYTYDSTGDPTGIRYVDNTGADVLTHSVLSTVHGQWQTSTGPVGTITYGYDKAGRLTRVDDPVDYCTRTYVVDKASNRTSLTSTNLNGATCLKPISQSFGYDSADRLTTDSPVYDLLGRTKTVPAAQAGGSALTAEYYVDDQVNTLIRNSVTTTYERDPLRRIRSWSDGTTTRTHHYAGDGDSPVWTAENTAATDWTRNVPGIAGDLAAIEARTGGVTTIRLQLADLHGDILATTPHDSPALSGSFSATEFGAPRTPATTRYGWLGAKQRAADAPGGIVLMGVRLYNPTTGRFLQTDPVYGGSDNAYDYAGHDPINTYDLDGRAKKDREDSRDLENEDPQNWQKLKGNKRGNKVAKKLGYADAHDAKRNVPRGHDIFVNKKNGNVEIRPVSNPWGSYEPIGNIYRVSAGAAASRRRFRVPNPVRPIMSFLRTVVSSGSGCSRNDLACTR